MLARLPSWLSVRMIRADSGFCDIKRVVNGVSAQKLTNDPVLFKERHATSHAHSISQAYYHGKGVGAILDSMNRRGWRDASLK